MSMGRGALAQEIGGIVTFRLLIPGPIDDCITRAGVVPRIHDGPQGGIGLARRSGYLARCLTHPGRAGKLGHTFEAVNRPG